MYIPYRRITFLSLGFCICIDCPCRCTSYFLEVPICVIEFLNLQELYTISSLISLFPPFPNKRIVIFCLYRLIIIINNGIIKKHLQTSKWTYTQRSEIRFRLVLAPTVEPFQIISDSMLSSNTSRLN